MLFWNIYSRKNVKVNWLGSGNKWSELWPLKASRSEVGVSGQESSLCKLNHLEISRYKVVHGWVLIIQFFNTCPFSSAHFPPRMSSFSLLLHSPHLPMVLDCNLFYPKQRTSLAFCPFLIYPRHFSFYFPLPTFFHLDTIVCSTLIERHHVIEGVSLYLLSVSSSGQESFEGVG